MIKKFDDFDAEGDVHKPKAKTCDHCECECSKCDCHDCECDDCCGISNKRRPSYQGDRKKTWGDEIVEKVSFKNRSVVINKKK